MKLYVKHGPDKVYLSVTAETRAELLLKIGGINFELDIRKGVTFTVNEVKAELEENNEYIGLLVGALIGLIGGPIGMIIGAAFGVLVESGRQERANQDAIKFNQSPKIKTFKIEEDEGTE